MTKCDMITIYINHISNLTAQTNQQDANVETDYMLNDIRRVVFLKTKFYIFI